MPVARRATRRPRGYEALARELLRVQRRALYGMRRRGEIETVARDKNEANFDAEKLELDRLHAIDPEASHASES